MLSIGNAEVREGAVAVLTGLIERVIERTPVRPRDPTRGDRPTPAAWRSLP